MNWFYLNQMKLFHLKYIDIASFKVYQGLYLMSLDLNHCRVPAVSGGAAAGTDRGNYGHRSYTATSYLLLLKVLMA